MLDYETSGNTRMDTLRPTEASYEVRLLGLAGLEYGVVGMQPTHTLRESGCTDTFHPFFCG